VAVERFLFILLNYGELYSHSVMMRPPWKSHSIYVVLPSQGFIICN